MGQDGETFSLTQGFRDKADNPDLLRTTETARDNEQQTFLMGMGDGLVLQNSGRIALSNASDKAVIEAERKERDKQAYQRALELVSQRLNDIQTEMIDLETKIADSSVIIANNITDIDFIRSLDTDTLYGTDGGVRDDVSALLKKHGYEDLEGMSENDIRHILTVIEVQAIEQNIAEQDKITGWLDRHGKLRGQARDIADASPSSDQRQDASDIASRDPEQLARDRMQAVTAQNHAPQETVTEAFVEVKKDLGTQNFSF